MIEANRSVSGNLQSIDLPAKSDKIIRGTDDARMFNRGNNQSTAILAIGDTCQSEQREIVRFRAAAGEDEPIGRASMQIHTEHLGDALARIFQHSPRPAAKLVLAFRIREPASLALRHRLGHFRQQRRRRVVVEVDGLHGSSARTGGM